VFLVLFVLVVYFQFCLYFSHTQKSIKISVVLLNLQRGMLGLDIFLLSQQMPLILLQTLSNSM
jgi:hypothetical protein